MFCVYFLRSLKDDGLYIGKTNNLPDASPSTIEEQYNQQKPGSLLRFLVMKSMVPRLKPLQQSANIKRGTEEKS